MTSKKPENFYRYDLLSVCQCLGSVAKGTYSPAPPDTEEMVTWLNMRLNFWQANTTTFDQAYDLAVHAMAQATVNLWNWRLAQTSQKVENDE